MRSIVKNIVYILIFNLMMLAPLMGQGHANMAVDKLEIIVPTQPPETCAQFVATIRERMKTKPGTLFNQADFDCDLKMLIQDYDRVEPHVEVDDGKIIIQLKIWQNPNIRFINWEGVEKVKISAVKKELDCKEGSLYNRIAFNKQFNKIKAFYIKEGFFEAEASYDVSYDECTNQVDITIKVCEGRAGKISQIFFKNFTCCEEEEVMELMVTKKYNLFLTWMTGEGMYNEDAIQRDRFVITNYFQNKGYADARIDIQIVEAVECNRIMVLINVDKGEYYALGDISFEGNCLFSNEDLQQCLDVCPDDPFSPEKLHNICGKIMDLYGKYGYIEASVIFEPQLVEGKERVYCVKFLIDEGEQFCVGLIKVLGNCTTQTNVILHETLLVPGELFNLEKLKLTEERLNNIGYFSNVNVYAVKTTEDSLLCGNYRDVIIEVEETNTGNIGAFLGFSTAENIFGGVNITEKNFNYKGFRYLFRDGYNALRGGGEYAHITLQIGLKSTQYGLSWTKPYFRDTLWNVGFDLDHSINTYISDDIDIKTTSFILHASYNCNAFVKVGPHLRLTYADIRIDDDCNDKKNNVTISNETKDHRPGCNKSDAEKSKGLIAAVGMSWVYNSTDSCSYPTRGLRSSIEGEVAGFNGQNCFLSLGYLNSYYYTLGDKFATLKLRGDFRFIQPMRGSTARGLPLDERFFLGGDNNVRGYRPYRLGPKLNNDDEEPEGGISMQFFSAELSRQFYSRLDGFIFFDCGAVSIRTWEFGPYYYSIGVGARIKILDCGPPLTIGVGLPLNPKHHSDVKRFFLNVGGKF